MFCKNCGKEVKDEAVVCVNCGCSLEKKAEVNPEHNESKAGMGVLFALLFGLIGLLIGILMYPENTVARKTFMKAWGITFGCSIAAYVLIYIIFFASLFML